MGDSGSSGKDHAVERFEAARRRFARRLGVAVSAAGYGSLADFARAAGIDPSTIRHWAAGPRHLPSTGVLIIIAEQLGVTCDWLLGADEPTVLKGIIRAREIEGRGHTYKRADVHTNMRPDERPSRRTTPTERVKTIPSPAPVLPPCDANSASE